MVIVNESLGCPVSEWCNARSELPPDIGCYASSLPGSMIRSACVFTFAKTNRGRLRESLVLLALAAGPIFVGLLRTTESEIDELIESLGLGLQSLPELDESSLTRLLADLEHCVGCHFAWLDGFPERLIDERLATWRQSRLVELSQANRQARFVELQSQVDHECAAIDHYLKSYLKTLKQGACTGVAEAQQKLPQVSWLQIHNYLSHADPKIARNRRQSILLFPALVHVAMQKPDGPFGIGLRAVIDTGQPMVDYVANRWQVRPVVVRRLRSVGYDDIGTEWADGPRSLAQILSVIPPEKYPRTRDQWRVFTEQAQLISTVLKHPLGSESVRLFMHGASRRGWGKTQAMHADLIQQVNNFEAFTRDLGRATRIWNIDELQVFAHRQLKIEAHRLLSTMLLSLGMTKLLRIAQQWQGYWAKSERHLRVEKSNFPVLLDQPFVTDELYIVQLNSASDLELESSEMGHCVDSYVSKCRTGTSVIFSVRSAAGIRLSTFELAINRKGIDGFEGQLIRRPCKIHPGAPANRKF